MTKNLIYDIERTVMKIKTLWFAAIAGLMILACAEKEPVYPWLTDASVQVEANGKLVGYEFFAKW